MNVKLVRASVQDAPLIHQMQQEAFAGLLATYQDFDTNPACETLEHVQARLEQPFTFYYLIEADGEHTGAIRVVDKGNGESKCISPLFVLLAWRGRGIAQRAMRMAEDIHGAENWCLGTILQEPGNCHLYEKMGYRKTGETLVVNNKMTLVFYNK